MVCQIGKAISAAVDKIPNPVKSTILAGCSIKLGQEACLIAQDCAKMMWGMSLDLTNKKGLELSVNEVPRSFSVLLPQLYLFGSMGLGAVIMVKLSYDYAKKMFKKRRVEEPQLILDYKND